MLRSGGIVIARQLQMYRYSRVAELPTGTLASDLGLQVAGFTAGAAIVNAIFTQADFIEALAQRAIFIAGAASFRLIAHHAHEFFCHAARLARFGLSGNGRWSMTLR
jgi:hypothetical protein